MEGVSAVVAENTEDVHTDESPDESLDNLRWSRTEVFCLKFSTKCSMSSSILLCMNRLVVVMVVVMVWWLWWLWLIMAEEVVAMEARASSLSGLDSIAMVGLGEPAGLLVGGLFELLVTLLGWLG